MRNPAVAAVIASITLLSMAMPTSAQSSEPAIQSLFVGDKTCADSANACVFSGIAAQHRYLHVLVHYLPNTAEWRVQAGESCINASDIGGGVDIGPDGWVEQVVDLATVAPTLLDKPGCYVFRGRNGYDTAFYAAYFDDSPSPDADAVYPDRAALNGRPDLPDLDVQMIHRTPSFDYDSKPNSPKAGQAVKFVARVANVGARVSPGFTYSWTLDGKTAGSGTVSQTLAPAATVTLSFPWRWDPAPHTAELRVVPAGDDGSSSNNSLAVRTNALLLGFWVERSAYDYFNQNQWLYCAEVACSGSDSFEDWLQRQAAAWNALFASSSYPGLAPAGVADRVAVDEVNVVPDGSLPLHGGGGTYSPDLADKSVDLEWGLPSKNVGSYYHLHWENPFDVDWGLIHELNHVRSMADMYRFDVGTSAGDTVGVVGADGTPALGPAGSNAHLHPFVTARTDSLYYENAEQDLMSCPCTPRYSPYSVLVLNRIRNRRARCGNTSPPCNLGDWYRDLPPVNILRVRDAGDQPLRSGTLRLFFDKGTTYGGHAFRQQDSQTLPIVNGGVTLPLDPFHAGGNPGTAGHNILLLEIQSPGVDEFCFQEPTSFNMAYWLGYRDRQHPAIFDLQAGHDGRNGCLLQLPPTRVNEPFAASPYASSVKLAGIAGSGKRRVRLVHVRIVDDQSSPQGMDNRRVEVRSASGSLVATAYTRADGRSTLRVPLGRSRLHVVDATDNNLTVGGVLETRSH